MAPALMEANITMIKISSAKQMAAHPLNRRAAKMPTSKWGDCVTLIDIILRVLKQLKQPCSSKLRKSGGTKKGTQLEQVKTGELAC